MALQPCSLPVGATIAITGGTATSFVANSAEVKGGIQVVDSTNTNAVTRASMTFRTIKEATLDSATGTYVGKTKRQAQIVRPKVQADSRVTFPLGRIELEIVPENTPAEIEALLDQIAMIAASATFREFWKIGSKA